MKIYEKTNLSKCDQELLVRGFGETQLYNMKFSYEYTAEQREKNATLAKKAGSEQVWIELCYQSAKKRSEHMQPIMKAIAGKTCCIRYEKENDISYDSDAWDLHFWCNDFSVVTGGACQGRDFSYFMLSFNKKQSKKQQEFVLEKVQEVLSDFESDENLSVEISTLIVLFETKIAEEVKRVAPELVGKHVTNPHYLDCFDIPDEEKGGRVVERDGAYYFMRKRARTRGYKLTDIDILRIFWDLQDNLKK